MVKFSLMQPGGTARDILVDCANCRIQASCRLLQLFSASQIELCWRQGQGGEHRSLCMMATQVVQPKAIREEDGGRWWCVASKVNSRAKQMIGVRAPNW